MFKSLFLKFASEETLINMAMAIVEAILKDPKKVATFESILQEIADAISMALKK